MSSNTPPDCLPVSTLMVSTSYPTDLQDWRGVFIRHLATALAERNDLRLSLWSPPGVIPSRARLVTTDSEQRWLAQLMKQGGIAHVARSSKLRGLMSAGRLLWSLRNLYRRERAVDVYHVNWLQNALPLPRNGKPLLVTVLGTDMSLLSLPAMAPLLRRVMRGRQVAICPNAKWMVPELERRFGDLATIRYVPFGIEPRWFELTPKSESPQIWLCVSRITRGKLGSLLEWSEPHFQGGARELHLLGPMQESIALPDWIHYHGATDPDDLSARWFPAVSGLITLSQHAEGRPQVMLEAMAASLPVIASAIPAHVDLLANGELGWICRSANQLGEQLALAESPETRVPKVVGAKNWVSDNVGTWNDCARRYVDIYKTLLAPTS